VAASFASHLAADYGTDAIQPVLPRLRPQILEEIATDEQALTGRIQEPLRGGVTAAAPPVVDLGLSETFEPADVATAPAPPAPVPPALVAMPAPPAQLPMDALRTPLRQVASDETDAEKAPRGAYKNDNSGKGSGTGGEDHSGKGPGKSDSEKDSATPGGLSGIGSGSRDDKPKNASGTRSADESGESDRGS
jgi:hypothetical protein